MSMKTPVLLLIWNRPQTTKKVFARLREIKPQILFIAADGPRKDVESDKKKCLETRKVVDKVDWKCKVKRLYRDTNLGLKKSVPESISWFFKNNIEGIILEDDCLPDLSFFKFCQLMLKRYKNNKRIMHITGDNFQPQRTWNKNKYYFSKYPHIWGWATWRGAWEGYDVSMSGWTEFRKSKNLTKICVTFWEKMYWTAILDAVFRGKINTWDYQWMYAVWKSGGLSVNPGVNLVSNIGFGDGAVHTVSKNSKFNQLPTNGISSRLDDQSIEVNKEFDNYTSKFVFGINPLNSLARYIYYHFSF